jgi:hypothetical protein
MVSTVEGSPGRLEELDFLCPDVEIDVRELVDGRILRGRDAVRAYLDSLRSDVWRDLTMRVEAIAEQGDALIATVRLQGTGRRSGVPGRHAGRVAGDSSGGPGGKRAPDPRL